MKTPSNDKIQELRELVAKIQAKRPFANEWGPPLRRSIPTIVHLREKTQDFYGFSLKTYCYAQSGSDLLLQIPESYLKALKGFNRSLSSTDGLLYLDLETTGLLGAGTLPFLVGLGKWVDGEFVVRQYFLKDRALELEMLREIEKEIAASRAIVTYNGKTFDLPLLNARFIMSGRRPPPLPPHIDLLDFSRMLGWIQKESASLKECVRRFLGRERIGDVEGRLIPSLYFIYERERDESVLDTVFFHNRLDVLDMVSLARLFAGFLSGENRDEVGTHAAGRFHFRRKNPEMALYCLENSLGKKEIIETEREASSLRILAEILRKDGRWQEASRLWGNLIAQGYGVLDDYLWLARYYETKTGDRESLKIILGKACSKFKDPHPKRLLSRNRRLKKLGLL